MGHITSLASKCHKIKVKIMMSSSTIKKVLQRKSLDLLTTKHGLLGLIISIAFVSASIFLFGEAIVEWSGEKYATIFNSFSDNLMGKSYRTRLCLPVPIDVVYTWVNGTDPQLLADLRRVKAEISADSNKNASSRNSSQISTGSSVCRYANCIPAPIMVYPVTLPDSFSKDDLGSSAEVYQIERLTTDDGLTNITALHLLSLGSVKKMENWSIAVNGTSYLPKPAFYTSDITLPRSKMMPMLTIVSGFKRKMTMDQVREVLPKHINDIVFDIVVNGEVALFKTTTHSDSDTLRQSAFNFTVEKRYLQFAPANLVFDLNYNSQAADILTSSRFEDNEELRYSLRSLEQYAPWVRHVYIVTNGQIPYWLNLDNPRVTLVTHSEIFPNKTHLPTFSSPAIESHLHRIPGLSHHFLYLNDDVMFGAQSWPDDFYTHSRGQKVYLAWNIPDCAPGCPQSWINDGYCDRACNVSECGFDANDCKGGAVGYAAGGGAWNNHQSWNSDSLTLCNQGCSNSWIADQYCDAACNSKSCGFDAGDCGVGNYGQLYRVTLSPDRHEYFVPQGIEEFYLNHSSLIVNGTEVSSASYVPQPVIRAAAIALKDNVITFVLTTNISRTIINVSIDVGKTQFNLSVVVDTRPTLKPPPSSPKLLEVIPKEVLPEKEPEIQREKSAEKLPVFNGVPDSLRGPQLVVGDGELKPEKQKPVLQNRESLIDDLQKKLDAGELTLKGFEKRKTALWSATSLVNSSALHPNPALADGDAPARVEAPFGKEALGNNTVWKSRQLQSIGDDGFLPWEQHDKIFYQQVQETDRRRRHDVYQIGTVRRRHLMDTFAQSLHHVNDLYTARFGHKARKVPGHVPHFIDQTVMNDLQDTFQAEWEKTSSNRIRSADDMQYAFSYYYFLTDSQHNNTANDFINDMDIDSSGVLSDRELRTMATRIYDIPLDLQSLLAMENDIINCSSHLTDYGEKSLTPTQHETYFTAHMPQVTLKLLSKCDPILRLVKKKVPPKSKYKYEVMGDEQLMFKMIGSNVSTVVGQLDDIRRHSKKFICLNDNIDHSRAEAQQVKALLADFYESMFPIRSQFELPLDYRNRFLHVEELRRWKRYRDSVMYALEGLLVLLILYTAFTFYEEQIYKWWNKGRRPRSTEIV